MPLPSLHSGRWSVVRVFLLAFVVYAYFMPQWADWNIDSRLDLVHALVDQRTVRIDAFHYNTWDKAKFQGHFYSDKAPGTAVLGAVVYSSFVAAQGAPLLGGAITSLEQSSAWTVPIQLGKTDTQVQPAAKGRNLGGCQRTGVAGNVQYIPWGNRLVPPLTTWALSKYVVTVGSVDLLSALFAAFFFWFLGIFTVSLLARLLLTGLYAVGTVALPYATNFYSHQIVAGFLFVAFALVFLRVRRHGPGWFPAAAGFLLGLALFTEYTVALIVAAIGLYSLWGLRRSPVQIGTMCLAGAAPVAGLLVYNYLCFGSPLDTGYAHDYCWSAAQAVGFDGFTYPQLGPLFDLTFGSYRGLFYMSPFLLLGAPGAMVMGRRGYRREAIFCLATVVFFILAISSYWGWNGGRTVGPRYLVPAVPFLAFPVIFYLDALRHARWGWILVGITGIWSLAVTWIEFGAGLTFPTSWLRNPIGQFSLPALQHNQIAPNAGFFLGLAGWESLLPLLALLLAVAFFPWHLRPWLARGPAAQGAASSTELARQ